MKLARRQFVRNAYLALSGLACGSAFLARYGERTRVRVREVRVPLPDLPPSLEGFRICQLSDLHRGPMVPEEFLRRAVDRANTVLPDLAVVTGDFVSSGAQFAPSAAAAVCGLRARYGVFGILGNHDYRHGTADPVCGILEDAGIRMLTNAAAPIPVPGAEWWLCGVDDVLRGRPDLDAALRDVPPGAFRVLLCHEPDFADEAASRGIPLQLSGHSHWGQVTLPGAPPLVLPSLSRKYPKGLQRVEGSGTRVYTNAGLGVVGVPFRLNCPPEVTLLTLVHA